MFCIIFLLILGYFVFLIGYKDVVEKSLLRIDFKFGCFFEIIFDEFVGLVSFSLDKDLFMGILL